MNSKKKNQQQEQQQEQEQEQKQEQRNRSRIPSQAAKPKRCAVGRGLAFRDRPMAPKKDRYHHMFCAVMMYALVLNYVVIEKFWVAKTCTFSLTVLQTTGHTIHSMQAKPECTFLTVNYQ
jgi:hypothetical protein